LVVPICFAQSEVERVAVGVKPLNGV
jgi:hypothetical protein